MNYKKPLLSTAILAVLTTLTIGAQASVYISPQIEYFFPDSNRHVDDSLYYGLGLGHQMTDRFSMEVTALASNQHQNNVGEVKGRRYRLDGVYNLSDHRLTPYVVLGGGYSDLHIDKANNQKNAFIDAGLGVKYAVSDSIRLRTQALAYQSTNHNHDTDAGITMAVDFVFGQKHVAASEPAPAAACGDEDHDGVSDCEDKCPGTPANEKVDATGCSDHVSVRLKVLFDFDKSTVKPEYDSEIKKTADFLNARPKATAVIEGHTDSVGTDKYNQRLSERRANAVKNVLVHTYGIDASRLQAKGYGESKPIASNTTVDGREQNRRVMSEFEGVMIKANDNK